MRTARLTSYHARHGRDTECGADAAVAVHPGLINTNLARGWLVSTALPVPPVLRPLVAPVVRTVGSCWVTQECRRMARQALHMSGISLEQAALGDAHLRCSPHVII